MSEDPSAWPVIEGEEAGDSGLSEWVARAKGAAEAALAEADLLEDGRQITFSHEGAPRGPPCDVAGKKDVSVWTALGAQEDPRAGLYVSGPDSRWTQVILPPGGVGFVCGARA